MSRWAGAGVALANELARMVFIMVSRASLVVIQKAKSDLKVVY
jgi:hypothetical protein